MVYGALTSIPLLSESTSWPPRIEVMTVCAVWVTMSGFVFSIIGAGIELMWRVVRIRIGRQL